MTLVSEPSLLVPDISRSDRHDYTYIDKEHDVRMTVPGVSNIISIIGLEWDIAQAVGARNAARAAVRMADAIPRLVAELGEEGARKVFSSKEAWGPDPSGSILGTQVHSAIEDYLNGRPPAIPSHAVQIRLDHFRQWWEASGWTLRLSEAMIVHPTTEHSADGWGGTLDILAKDMDGRTVLADLKTGRMLPKHIIQLTGYSMGRLIQPAGEYKAWPMPQVDRHVIIHVTEDGCRPVEVAVGTPERMTFLAALEIWHWSRSQKGLKL